MFSGVAHGSALERGEPIAVGSGALDALLGGGIPRGQVVELSGAASSGKATLALAVCMRALERGQAAAWIDPAGAFWPVSALEQGASLDRLLVVRVPDAGAALRAAHILLASAGAVAALVVDWPPGAAVRDRQLVALQRLAERSASALLFLTERPATAPSLGAQVALRLHLSRCGAGAGARIRIDVLRNKQGASQRAIEEPATRHGTDRLRLHRSL
ncbi:MAG TPA: hypothetical protein VKZ63_07060 [Kofleriaceae bacterium]|nr:hypothetical protein [Kofleriaceae bacterium]